MTGTLALLLSVGLLAIYVYIALLDLCLESSYSSRDLAGNVNLAIDFVYIIADQLDPFLLTYVSRQIYDWNTQKEWPGYPRLVPMTSRQTRQA